MSTSQATGPPRGDGLVAEVYRQVRRDFGALVEPITVHAPVPTLLAAAWCVNRETLLVGRVRRELKEAVATVVSQLNRCPYCVDAHTAALDALGERDLLGHEGRGFLRDEPSGDEQCQDAHDEPRP